jgi:hypothetical protein
MPLCYCSFIINKNSGYHLPSIPNPDLLICSHCCPDPEVKLLQLLEYAEALLMRPIQPVLPFAGPGPSPSPSPLIYSPTAWGPVYPDDLLLPLHGA